MASKNVKFPGRPNYTGPLRGWFALLHHDLLYEESDDVMERVHYVRRRKLAHEIPIRLHNMLYLNPELCPAIANRALIYADYEAKRAALYADYEAKRAPLDADYEAKRSKIDADYYAKWTKLNDDHEAKCAPFDIDHEAKCAALNNDYLAKRRALDAEILAYIKVEIPDCAWNGGELVF